MDSLGSSPPARSNPVHTWAGWQLANSDVNSEVNTYINLHLAMHPPLTSIYTNLLVMHRPLTTMALPSSMPEQGGHAR